MTPARAARLYAASLIERQLAAAHFGRVNDTRAAWDQWMADKPVNGTPDEISAWYGRCPGHQQLILDTFDSAPPAVAAALAKLNEKERLAFMDATAEAMAAVMEELQKSL